MEGRRWPTQRPTDPTHCPQRSCDLRPWTRAASSHVGSGSFCSFSNCPFGHPPANPCNPDPSQSSRPWPAVLSEDHPSASRHLQTQFYSCVPPTPPTRPGGAGLGGRRPPGALCWDPPSPEAPRGSLGTWEQSTQSRRADGRAGQRRPQRTLAQRDDVSLSWWHWGPFHPRWFLG